MGWWKIEYWRFNKAGDKVSDLDDVDLEHIAEMIKEGYTEGEVNDEDMEESK